MAGMNLHEVGRSPDIIIRTVQDPPRPRFYGNEMLVQEYIEEFGTISMECPCGNAAYNSLIDEQWRREATVDLSAAHNLHPESDASISSAEYYEEMDESSWACTACGRVPSQELQTMLTGMDKEPY